MQEETFDATLAECELMSDQVLFERRNMLVDRLMDLSRSPKMRGSRAEALVRHNLNLVDSVLRERGIWYSADPPPRQRPPGRMCSLGELIEAKSGRMRKSG